MAARYASGKKALAECDICGFRYKLSQLKTEVVKGRRTEIKACPDCWSEDHPQLKVGMYPVFDPQALRDPRPDSAGYAQSRATLVSISGVQTSGSVGYIE